MCEELFPTVQLLNLFKKLLVASLKLDRFIACLLCAKSFFPQNLKNCHKNLFVLKFSPTLIAHVTDPPLTMPSRAQKKNSKKKDKKLQSDHDSKPEMTTHQMLSRAHRSIGAQRGGSTKHRNKLSNIITDGKLNVPSTNPLP